MSLPEDSLRKLAEADVFSVGDIYWLPEELLNYDSGKDGRFCLLVHIERGANGAPVRAHFIVGSTKRGSKPELLVAPNETDLRELTFFSFHSSSPVDIGTLRAEGKWRGRLDQSRQADIESAILTSNLGILKKLRRGLA